jgi:Protein of unknown function (DUF3489)
MRSVCYERVWPVEEFSANGEQCLNRLCQLRGQAQTLRDEVVKMLSRAAGATLPELMKAFKWQAHSVRGFVSVLASKHGFKIESSKVDGIRLYRI